MGYFRLLEVLGYCFFFLGGGVRVYWVIYWAVGLFGICLNIWVSFSLDESCWGLGLRAA